MTPRSRGEIRLAGTDPRLPPRIAPRYLSAPADIDLLVEAVHVSRDIVQAPSLDDWRGEEVFPGTARQSRGALIEFIRRKAETIYHPVGTCRMGPAGERDSVVDVALRVHGLAGLRVVDASIMPRLVSGNTNAPTIMIAERAAALILGQGALA